MKRLTQIFQALLGVVALILTALVAAGRLAWRTIRNWWKNCSKWLRRSIATVLILITIGFVALVVYASTRMSMSETTMTVESLAILLVIHSPTTCGESMTSRRVNTTDKINWLSEVPENDSLAVYALPGKHGYINVNTGRIVIDAEAPPVFSI